MKADLVVYDEMSVIYYADGSRKPIEYTTASLTQKALGGTEFEILLLMDEYAKLGKTVICFNNNQFASEHNGIKFIPRQHLPNLNVSCKNLITSRYSQIPSTISFDQCILWMHDVALPRAIHFDKYLSNQDKYSIVCPSEWSRSLFPKSWKASVIPNMIPDWVYSYPIQKKQGCVYASAALKGLEPTLEFWNFINSQKISEPTPLTNHSQLKILSPGYDTPDKNHFPNISNIEFLGALPFHKVVHEIAKSEFLFYVNDMPETFCIVAVLAEILKTKVRILTLRGGGALPETINTHVYTDYIDFIDSFNTFVHEPEIEAKDYRISTIFPLWQSLLK